MSGIDDAILPNTRPLKHDWVIHAELNAILNCEHRPVGASLYCTHMPCLHCFFNIVTAGISHIYYIKDSSTTNTDGKDTDIEIAQYLARDIIKITAVDFKG
jgi:dCMP deaminase